MKYELAQTHCVFGVDVSEKLTPSVTNCLTKTVEFENIKGVT